ncbi:MAG TPA: DUF2865 domain-containing protein [Pseudolabrys sp.]|nr:DUF2865 domain-containing protein [Pseudolabrys sp.]
MRETIYKFVAASVAVLSSLAISHAQSANPACQRLEAQLATLDRGNADPARADQIHRAEDAVNRQQFEVDRMVAQSRRMGCESSGFFSIFSNPPAQCGPLSRQIDQQRFTLERMRNQLEQLNGGTTERAAQRQSLLIALGDNGCGPQYRSAAIAGQQGGFFDRLFGGNNNNAVVSTPLGPMGGTFRTVCVRTCDGFYFPISYATSPDHFREDELTCQRMCPAAEATLYTYHNPGEEMAQAVSLNGRFYTELPTAFQYRKALDPACSCRRPGESWAQALKALGPDATIAPGDVVITEQNAKQLSQPRLGADGKPIRPELRGPVSTPAAVSAPSMAEAPGEVDPAKRKVRTVGPTFLPPK